MASRFFKPVQALNPEIKLIAGSFSIAASASTRTCPGRGPPDIIPGSVYRELPRGRRDAREPPPGLPLAPPTSPS